MYPQTTIKVCNIPQLIVKLIKLWSCYSATVHYNSCYVPATCYLILHRLDIPVAFTSPDPCSVIHVYNDRFHKVFVQFHRKHYITYRHIICIYCKGRIEFCLLSSDTLYEKSRCLKAISSAESNIDTWLLLFPY